MVKRGQTAAQVGYGIAALIVVAVVLYAVTSQPAAPVVPSPTPVASPAASPVATPGIPECPVEGCRLIPIVSEVGNELNSSLVTGTVYLFGVPDGSAETYTQNANATTLRNGVCGEQARIVFSATNYTPVSSDAKRILCGVNEITTSSYYYNYGTMTLWNESYRTNGATNATCAIVAAGTGTPTDSGWSVKVSGTIGMSKYPNPYLAVQWDSTNLTKIYLLGGTDGLEITGEPAVTRLQASSTNYPTLNSVRVYKLAEPTIEGTRKTQTYHVEVATIAGFAEATLGTPFRIFLVAKQPYLCTVANGATDGKCVVGGVTYRLFDVVPPQFENLNSAIINGAEDSNAVQGCIVDS